MKVAWLHYGAINNVANGYASTLASARYRVLLPAARLNQWQHQVEFIELDTETDIEHIFEMLPEKVVVSKLLYHKPELLLELSKKVISLATRIKESDKTLIIDNCDYHFSHPVYGGYYKTMNILADIVVASTRSLAELIQAETGRKAVIISDPVENEKQIAEFSPPRQYGFFEGVKLKLFNDKALGEYASRLRVLWFGGAPNIDTLHNLIPALSELSTDVPIDLNLMTARNCGVEQLCVDVKTETDPAFVVRFTPWSVEALRVALKNCDVVILPSNTDDTKKLVKSPNRLVESLWAGRFVIAHPVPSYKKFDEWAWISEGLEAGLRWAIDNPDLVVTRIKAAQKYVNDYHSQDVIAREWEKTLEMESDPFDSELTITSHQHNSDSYIEKEPLLRLNLGCGDKILPGYINVDVAASRNGLKPDVICDLHDLTLFEDASAQEILSVHVVEHFWRWEVIDILKEWLRVLAPGGQMIIECPNLISACKEFLSDPDRASNPGPEGQRSMWVFYGDPSWQDPLMVHRWGYTPASLGKLLLEVGLIDIEQKPAVYKLREPRDMRIVGFKPKV